MADLSDLNFDANEVEPNGNFDPVPAGKYNVIITESEMKPTKAGNGEYLELKMQIQGGNHDGRMLWDRLNLRNPNEQAVQIARQTLSAICHAIGIMKPKDSADLHGKTLVASVKLRTTPQGNPMNEVKGYLPYDSGVRPAATQNGGAAPWKR